MDIVQLEHFMAIASERTFTRAAEKVFRTQSALSQSIRKLEENLGATLFTRAAVDVSLTEAGKVLAGYAHKILDLRDEATRAIEQLQSLKTGNLSILADELAGVYLLPHALFLFVERFPDINVSVQGSKPDDICAKVLDREAQLGFVKDAPVFRELECVNVYSDEMTLIASPRHPLALRKQLSIRDLDNVPLIVRNGSTSSDNDLRRLFKEHGAHFRVAAQLRSFENLKSFVCKGLGVGIVPRITAIQDLCRGTLIEIPVLNMNVPRNIHMVYRRDFASEAASQLIEIMRKREIFPTLELEM